MQKNNEARRLLRVMIFSSFLSAMSIVFGKYLAVNVGEVLRFSFENLPIIFAGMAFGPIAGAAVGVVSDIVGCFLVGYGTLPMVTLGAALVGAVAGLWRFLPLPDEGFFRYIKIAVSVVAAHTVGSVLVKTVDLAAMYGMTYGALLLWRALNYLIISALEVLILSFLMRSNRIRTEISKLNRRRK